MINEIEIPARIFLESSGQLQFGGVQLVDSEEATMNDSMLKVGDNVRRRQLWDGSERAGNPVGPLLTIVKAYPVETFAIYQLADGRSEFEFNLCKEDAAEDRIAS